MTTLQITLPDAIARAAQAAGLLTPEALHKLISSALDKRASGDFLLGVSNDIKQVAIAPMSDEEIAAEIKAAREARHHADRH